jgi:uncharacterized protein YraI
MVRKSFLAIATAAGLALSAAAIAQQAYTTRSANVRAGPAVEFPVVATLPPGVPVRVDGCVADYLWCDVEFGGGRGWVSTHTLQSHYQNRVVPLYGYGATIGLPIISFSLGSYWGSHYSNRPFYRDHAHWEQRWHGNSYSSRYSNNHGNYGNNHSNNYGNNNGRQYDNSRSRAEYRGNQPRVEAPQPNANQNAYRQQNMGQGRPMTESVAPPRQVSPPERRGGPPIDRTPANTDQGQ